MVDQTAGFLYESAIMMATPFATAIFCIVMAQRVRCMKLMWPKKLVCWERTRFIVHSAMRVLICLLGFFFVWFPFMRLLICFLECFIQMEDNFRKYYFMPTMTLILMLVYLHGYFQSKDGKTANVSHNATTHKKKMRAPAEDPDADALGRFWANTFYWSSPDEWRVRTTFKKTVKTTVRPLFAVLLRETFMKNWRYDLIIRNYTINKGLRIQYGYRVRIGSEVGNRELRSF